MSRPSLLGAARRRLRESVPAIARRDAKIADLTARLEAERRQSGPPTPVAQGPWVAPTGADARDLIDSSGLLDHAWYAEQVAAAPEVAELHGDAARHYLQHGATAGLSPHPLFLASWYRSRTEALPAAGSAPRTDPWPLLHFVQVGARTGLSPHPLLDAAAYLVAHPDAADDPLGPLGHLLGPHGGTAVEVGLEGTVTGCTPVARTPSETVDAARRTAWTLHGSRGLGHLRRERNNFDHDAAERLTASLRDQSLPADPPLVSVVLPTKDRAAVLGAALDSVLAQTYQTWELVVVDDGSVDETPALLDRYTDPRLLVVRKDQPTGVAAARNSGLARARGTYVAYLDSDNTWEPDFLELMVRFMLRDGHRAAYAVSALEEVGGRGRRRFRGMPFSREALRERNYIDCICLVHERSLLDEVGAFDESLRRTVDWDLLIRIADRVDLGYLPVIATRYDVWEAGGNRITTDESVGYRYRVQQRTLLDERALRDGPDGSRVAGRTSVVVPALTDAVRALDTVRRVRSTTTGDVEIVVIADSRLPEAEHARLVLGLEDTPGVDVHRIGHETTLEIVRNVGAGRSSGDVLVFLPDGAWCEPRWLPPLREALVDHAATQPVLMTRGGAVWSAGLHLDERARAISLYRGLPADAPEVRGLHVVDAASASCVALRADVFADLGGFDPMSVDAWSSGVLSLQAATATGLPVACVGASRVSLLADAWPEVAPWQLRRQRSVDLLQRDAWRSGASVLTERLAADGMRLAGTFRQPEDGPDTRALVVHDRPERPLRWAIKIGAPDVPGRENWGDWHFAEALQSSLERLGHVACIDSAAEWHRASSHLDDVALNLRGLTYVDPHPGLINLLWVISHSDRVTPPEMAAYDQVFGASLRWSAEASRRSPRPVTPLLQCTDQRRFHPVPVDPSRAHEVLAVANARATRPTIDAALEAGVVPDVYGARWEGRLPHGAWKGHYIPNDELVTYYVSAGVVLNDHHEDMRVEGLLSNRLFDLAACEARVLSDHLPELHEVFGDVVSSWTEPRQIPDLVRRHLEETPEAAERRRELGAHVREHHTFDARAAVLAQTALELRRAREDR